MPTFTDNDQQSEIDKRYTSGKGGYGGHDDIDLGDDERAKLAEMEKNAGNTIADEDRNTRDNRANIDDARSKEESPWRYDPNTFRNRRQATTGKINLLKKKGPLGFIVALLLGGGGVLSLLFTPGLGIVQLKEVLTGDLNDQLAAMDIRTDHVLKAKLKNMQKTFSFCSSTVNVRCKFATMGGRQVKKFQKAGFELECEGGPCKEGILSRNKIKSIKSPGSDKVFTNPGEFTRFTRSNVTAASAMRKAYNPKFMGLTDKVSTYVFRKLGLAKKPVIDGKDKKKSDQKLRETVRSGSVDPDGKPITPDEKTGISEEDAKRASGAQKELLQEAEKVRSSGVKATTAGIKGGLKGGVKGIGVLGAVDSACTLYRTSLGIEAGAKLIRATQLARYAMNFLVVADAIKAGTATPDQVSYLGNIFAKTDTKKTIPDPNNSNKQIPNPFYGKSGYDSAGYKVAAYNDAPILTDRDMQYTVGGAGALGTLIATNGQIISKLGKNPRRTCNIVQNNFTRVGSIVAGVALGVVSIGTSLAVSVGISAAISVAAAIAEHMLIDILAGTVIDGNTYGAEAGDAVFSGTATILGDVAQARGLSPLTPSTIQDYQAATKTVKSEYVALGKYEAQDDQFDVMNQYSFLGSLARNLMPTIYSGDSILSKTASIVTLPLQLVGSVSADSSFNPDRYKRCDDTTYKNLGLSTDVFCNLRYGLTDTELSMDTDTVVDYMINGGYIDATTGEAKGDYAKYLESCTQRDEPIGMTGDSQETQWTTGKVCYDQSSKFQNFRVYTIDSSISDSMDGSEEDTGGAGGAGGGGPATSTGVPAWPLDKKWWDTDKADFLNAHLARGSDGTYTGTAWGSDNMGTSNKGGSYAADIGVPAGTKVYAMVGGTVISTNLCGAGDGIAIKSNVGGGTLGIAYMHGTHQQFKVGDTVQAGDYIMNSGELGCNVYGAHLHLGMAYNGKYICPQDVFLAIAKNQIPNWSTLPSKVTVGCGR